VTFYPAKQDEQDLPLAAPSPSIAQIEEPKGWHTVNDFDFRLTGIAPV
jgi:hypothetical protein